MTEETSATDAGEAQELPDVQEAPEADAPEVDDDSPALAYSPEDAAEAKLFGWKPREEWLGEVPETFVDDPAKYLEGVRKSRIFRTMDEKLSQAQETARRMDAMQAQQMERMRAGYEQRLEQIRGEKRKAVESADAESYDAWDKQERELERHRPVDAPQQPQPAQQEVLTYAETQEGSWLKNPALAQEAFYFLENNPAYKALSAMDQVDAAKDYVKRRYPRMFPAEAPKTEPQTPSAPKVDPGGLGSARSAGTKFAKLPGEAKQQFERFVKQGLFADTKADREEYANEYLNS